MPHTKVCGFFACGFFACRDTRPRVSAGTGITPSDLALLGHLPHNWGRQGERHPGRSLRCLIGCLDMETAPPDGGAVLRYFFRLWAMDQKISISSPEVLSQLTVMVWGMIDAEMVALMWRPCPGWMV